MALCAAACGAPAEPASPPGPSSNSVVVDPANVERVRGELPPGYEVSAVSGRATPLMMWGFGPDFTAIPPQCGALADPPVDGAAVRGWSASGDGGIVYAVVTTTSAGLDPALTADCGRWTVTAGQTSGTVTLVAAPPVTDAVTVGLTADATTVVEGGTETRLHADTVTAYLEDHLAFVTVVTDPGSPNPSLAPDFAAQLLVKTVAALRG